MRDNIAQTDHAHDHTPPLQQESLILAVAMIHHNLQQVGINPEYEEVLS
jgi:hypothetical protein